LKSDGKKVEVSTSPKTLYANKAVSSGKSAESEVESKS
jgi:hypothetical protein